MKTITIKAKEQEINKLLDILKELNISYELESNNYENTLVEYESGKSWQETKQELHKALNDYENGSAKLCTFKEVKSITDKIINRA
ncbi:hypothetical protein [Campylobacter jejuni]|uniref:hypothetical protein n=1 Tax=Campylobacter jejuni TaxID=197 RepID=UPI00087557FE|nr:hypothetical protein [Campylobacter jejuni]EAI9839136.1 hypothetical protein [Campylobacter jejuni]ECP6988794.1 hypothetical protein [Campylobacter jejuni]ECR3170765.1 hypothetical protein [Campylobacter jejuni]EGN5848193.1 hypothetical protein [Campylobacter jejuni]MBX1799072.1 hypothetical protein [Campylobacter jejuni]